MSITEELEHKKVQAVYLRKLLEHVNAEIEEIELINRPKDPCPFCNSTGVFKYGDERCPTCKGIGFFTNTRKVLE